MSEQLVPEIRFEGFEEEWEEWEAGRIGTFHKGNGYSKADVGTGDTPLLLYGRLYTQYELAVQKIDTFAALRPNSLISRGGEVLVPGSGETPEDIAVACALLQRGVIIGGDLNVIRPGAQTNSTFLALTLSSGEAKSVLSRRAQGKSVVHLHNSDLQQLMIHQPTLAEQQAIGTFFQHLDSLITQHRSKHARLQQTKASLMQRMFPQGDASEPELRFEGFSGEWEFAPLGSLGTSYGGLTGKGKADFGHGNARYVTYMNVLQHTLLESGSDFGAVEIDPRQHEVRTGDALFTISSETPEEVGMAAIWLGTGRNIYLNSFCFGFHPQTEVDPQFFGYVLRSNQVRAQIVTLAQGISRYNISKTKMMGIEVPLPSFSEQQAIGAFFAKIDSLINSEDQYVKKLQQVKSALLQKMFPRGEAA